MTDDFIAYTKAVGPQLELDETTAFLVIAATLLDLKAARLLPAGEIARRGGPRAAGGARPAVRPAAAVPGVQARRGDVRRARGRRAAQLSAGGVAGGPLRRPAARGDAGRRRRSVRPDRGDARSRRGRCRRWPPSTCTSSWCRCPSRPGSCWPQLERRGPGQWATFSELVADCREPIEIVGPFLALLELYRARAVAFDQSEPLGVLQVSWTGERPTSEVMTATETVEEPNDD